MKLKKRVMYINTIESYSCECGDGSCNGCGCGCGREYSLDSSVDLSPHVKLHAPLESNGYTK